MRIRKRAIILILGLLSSCGPQGNKVETVEVPVERQFKNCGGQWGGRNCNAEEKAYIKDIEFLSSKLQTIAKQSTLDAHLHIHKTVRAHYSNKFHIIGEVHDDLIMMLDNFAYLERELAPRDVIFLEGAHRNWDIKNECSYRILIKLHCTLDWARQGKDYDADEKMNFCKTSGDLWDRTEKELKLDALKIAKAECRGWDSPAPSLRARNASLVASLKDIERYPRKGFVIAGWYHSPVGEHYRLATNYYYNNNGQLWDNQTISDLYLSPDFRNETSTEEIYNYLYGKPAVFISHRRLVYDERFLPKRFPH